MTTRSGRTSKGSRGRLRIVAGIWRSRVLEIADVPGLRPTAERIRETLFNWLAPRIAGARCLDLYAGTGALGLEALSRGAASVVFVEKSDKALAALQRNIATLGAGGAEVLAGDAVARISHLSDRTFDVVFLDPPFAEDKLDELCRLMHESGLLAPGAVLYLEQDSGGPPPQLADGWTLVKNKSSGNVRYMLAAPPSPY